MKNKILKPQHFLVGPDGKQLQKPIKRLSEKQDGKVLCIYVPSTGPSMYREFVDNLFRITHPRNIARLRPLGITEYFVKIHSTFPICRNRNEIVYIAQKNQADLLMCLDNDMTHPDDIIYQLAKYNLPIVSGIYHHQSPPHLPVIYRCKKESEYTHYYDYPTDTMFDVDLVGMGCILIDMRVFDEIKPPYFKYDSNREDGVVNITEDVEFCKKVRKAGFSIMIDPAIQCNHLTTGKISNLQFKAFIQKYETYDKLLEIFGDGSGPNITR